MDQHHKNATRGGFPVCKAQIQGAKAQAAAQLTPVHDVARDPVGTAQQARRVVQAAIAQRLAHSGAGHAQAVYLVAVHACHVKTVGRARGVQQGVVACTFGTEPEVIAHQHVFGAQSIDQHLLHKGLRAERRQGGVEGQHHDLVHAAVRQVGNLVPKGAHAAGSQVGLARQAGKVVARVGLKGHDAAGHAALLGLAAQKRQHGLVAAMDAVKIADGQGAGRGQSWVLEAAKNLHGVVGAVCHLNRVYCDAGSGGARSAL